MKKIPAALIATLSTAGLVALVLSLSATAALRFGESYGYSLFLAAPFVGGAVATLLYADKAALRVRDVLSVASIVAALSSLCLLALGADGLMCVVLSIPVALPSAWLGGLLAHFIGKKLRAPPGRGAALALFPPLWLALAVEPRLGAEAELVSVATRIQVDADPATVWRNVIAFPPILTEPSLIFRMGIAYPTSASIAGQGVGAIRRCVFSTGVFVEPITAWDEGRRLEFDVVSNPPSMKEASLYPGLDVPHVRNTFASQRGRFVISQGGNGTVVLEGTTWYRQKLWPQVYWNFVADQIVHRIHLRVLEHIKRVSEAKGA